MNSIKRFLGIVWLLSGPVIIYYLLSWAFEHIGGGGTQDINNPVIWIIIITIFTPIAVGLMIFGWYALKGEYDKLPESSGDLE